MGSLRLVTLAFVGLPLLGCEEQASGGGGAGGGASGGGPAGGASATRSVVIDVTDELSAGPLAGVDVLAHDPSGALVDRSVTDASGRATLEVVDEGFVGAWARRTTTRSIEDGPIEDVDFLVSSAAVVPAALSEITIALDGFDPAEEGMFVRVEVAPIPGAVSAVAFPACAWRRPFDVAGAGMSAEASGVAPCPGRDDVELFVYAFDEAGDGIVAYGTVSTPFVPGGTADVSTTLDETEVVAFVPVDVIPVPGELASTRGQRRRGGTFAQFYEHVVPPQGSNEPWPTLLDAVHVGGYFHHHSTLSACVDGAFTRRDLVVSAPTSGTVPWDTARLAWPDLDESGVVLGEGERGDALHWSFGTSFDEASRAHSVRVPIPAGETAFSGPPALELPADLADFASEPGSPSVASEWRVAHQDLREAASFAAFLQAVDRPGFGELESVMGGGCD